MEIYLDPTKGRGYRAIDHIPADVLILQSQPYTFTISYPCQRERRLCWYCFHHQANRAFSIRCNSNAAKHTSPKNLKCPAVYCSYECQLADEKEGHANACTYLKQLRAACLRLWQRRTDNIELNLPLLEVQLKGIMSRQTWDDLMPSSKSLNAFVPTTDEYELMQMAILALARKNFKISQSQTYQNAVRHHVDSDRKDVEWSDLEAMQDNEENVLSAVQLRNNDPTSVMRVYMSYHFLKQIVKLPKHLLSSCRDFRSIIYREMANSFGIWDSGASVGDESELMGYALYPHATFFNHSCAPNVRKVQRGRSLEFYTSRNIEPGEELYIAYGNVDGCLKVRRDRLLMNYFFTCECSRCLQEEESEEISR